LVAEVAHLHGLEGKRAVHVEEVARQQGLRLRSEELAPGGVVTALRRRWYAQAAEDTTDCGGADPVTEAA
jgi:hypothetical protein